MDKTQFFDEFYNTLIDITVNELDKHKLLHELLKKFYYYLCESPTYNNDIDAFFNYIISNLLTLNYQQYIHFTDIFYCSIHSILLLDIFDYENISLFNYEHLYIPKYILLSLSERKSFFNLTEHSFEHLDGSINI